MTLPTADAVIPMCPECGDVRLEVLPGYPKNTPDMHHDFTQVTLERCPKCGIEVTITTMIDVKKPIIPKKVGGLYLPPEVMREKGR